MFDEELQQAEQLGNDLNLATRLAKGKFDQVMLQCSLATGDEHARLAAEMREAKRVWYALRDAASHVQLTVEALSKLS